MSFYFQAADGRHYCGRCRQLAFSCTCCSECQDMFPDDIHAVQTGQTKQPEIDTADKVS